MRQKEFFQSAIFASWLFFIAITIHAILYILVAAELFFYDEYLFWFIVISFLNLSVAVFVLSYYHFRSFTFTFWSALASIITSTLLSLTFYFIVVQREFQLLYLPISILSILAAIVYGISLIVAPAGKRPLLKVTGILVLALSAIIIALILINTFSPAYPGPVVLSVFDRWFGFFGNFTHLLILFNFYDELKKTKASDPDISFLQPLKGWLPYFGMLGIVLCLLSGFMMITETSTRLKWQKHNQEQARALVTKFGSTLYKNIQGDTLSYLLIKPDSIQPGQKYPLVVCLPAGNFEAPAAELLLDPVNKSRYPAFIFVPYCARGHGWGGNAGFAPRDAIVFDAINALNEPIDRNRQYVSGVSLGGFGSWHFITAHPEMFAAAIPVCGGGNPQEAGKFASVPVWAFHGANDKNVPVERSREMIEAIKKAGGNPRYTEFPNRAHGIWYEVTTTPGLLEWLFKQHKE